MSWCSPARTGPGRPHRSTQSSRQAWPRYGASTLFRPISSIPTRWPPIDWGHTCSKVPVGRSNSPKQAQTVTAGPQQLDDIAAPTAKYKDIATERIVSQRRLHLGGQSVEPTAHVGEA